MIGTVIRAALAALGGAALAFFVAVSAFADGPGREPVLTVAAILLAYGLAGLGLGARASPRYGFGLALPGLAVLLLYALGGEGRWWHLAYAIAIVAAATCGAYGGTRFVPPPR